MEVFSTVTVAVWRTSSHQQPAGARGHAPSSVSRPSPTCSRTSRCCRAACSARTWPPGASLLAPHHRSSQQGRRPACPGRAPPSRLTVKSCSPLVHHRGGTAAVPAAAADATHRRHACVPCSTQRNRLVPSSPWRGSLPEWHPLRARDVRSPSAAARFDGSTTRSSSDALPRLCAR